MTIHAWQIVQDVVSRTVPVEELNLAQLIAQARALDPFERVTLQGWEVMRWQAVLVELRATAVFNAWAASEEAH